MIAKSISLRFFNVTARQRPILSTWLIKNFTKFSLTWWHKITGDKFISHKVSKSLQGLHENISFNKKNPENCIQVCMIAASSYIFLYAFRCHFCSYLFMLCAVYCVMDCCLLIDDWLIIMIFPLCFGGLEKETNKQKKNSLKRWYLLRSTIMTS